MSPKPAIQRKSLHNELVTLLRDMIIQGKLGPGSRIPELALCDTFGVSRTPLREALKVLSVEGLVCLLPNRGARVAHVTRKEMEEIVSDSRNVSGSCRRAGLRKHQARRTHKHPQYEHADD
jgi:DNA-binding GntR family transcriptional regulator